MNLLLKVVLPIEDGPAAVATKMLRRVDLSRVTFVRFTFEDEHYLDVPIRDVRLNYDDDMAPDDQVCVQVVLNQRSLVTKDIRWFYADASRQEIFRRWEDAHWDVRDYEGDRTDL